MPPKKKSQPFEWSEEKKRVVITCFNRARELHKLNKDIIVALRKQFLLSYPECQLSAMSLYKYALAAEKIKQLPGETETRVVRWNPEKDTFLSECMTRAREENQRSIELGLQAGKIGCQGQFRKLVVQFFMEKYDEHTFTAICQRISRLRQECHTNEGMKLDSLPTALPKLSIVKDLSVGKPVAQPLSTALPHLSVVGDLSVNSSVAQPQSTALPQLLVVGDLSVDKTVEQLPSAALPQLFTVEDLSVDSRTVNRLPTTALPHIGDLSVDNIDKRPLTTALPQLTVVEDLSVDNGFVQQPQSAALPQSITIEDLSVDSGTVVKQLPPTALPQLSVIGDLSVNSNVQQQSSTALPQLSVIEDLSVDKNILTDSKQHYKMFQYIMKYWEFGYKFGSRSMFIGACAKCTMFLINESRCQRLKLFQGQPTIYEFYEPRDIPLKVIDSKTSKCYSCTLCDKRNLLADYNLSPKSIKALPLPAPIVDLADEDKRQICLVALKSNTAKASSDALRIFKHQRGDYQTERKGDACYFDMYAMIVNKSPLNTMAPSKKVIVTALKWLRENNHLYRRFSANYETLLRFVNRQPGQPLTVPVMSNVNFDPVSQNQTKTSVLQGEQSALMIPAYNVPSRGVNVGNTVAATQHVRNLNAAKDTHNQFVNVFIKDIYLEAKVFPWLFPYGTGGWCNTNTHGYTRGSYVRWRLYMCDSRFRNDIDYMFYMLDIIIKERLQYYSSTKINVAQLAEPLTREKIVQAEKSTNPYDQYGSEVPASIPNSRNYWASKTLDLIAISEHMGRVPDLFVTLTENDSWPELQAVIINGLAGVHDAANSKEFENVHKRGIPAMKFPIETVIAYYRRLREFRIRFLQDPKGPFGHVQDYWMRVEYQNRGALHVHLVIWVREGTMPTDIVSAEMPRFTEHPMNWKWREIVGCYQKHDCYQQRCFTGKKGKILSSCKYGFPYSLNDTICPNKGGVRYQYIRRNLEDSRIIPYNMPLLLFWDGHVNAQKVTDGGWELYLAKYVAKSEYPIRLRISRKKQSDCETYLRSRVVSLLEASALLQQYPHVFSSREVVYLPITVNPTYRFLKRISKESTTVTNVADDNELYYDTKLEKYLDRPNELSDLTYPQFFARYRYHQLPQENEELDDDCIENNYDANTNHDNKVKTLRDKKGRTIRQRVHHEAVVRFKDYSPYGSELEMYCLTKLLQNVPVNRENLAALKDNTGSYLEECMNRNLIEEEDEARQFLEGAAKRGISLNRLREIASHLINGNWLQDQDIDQLLETVAPYQMKAERVRTENVNDDDDNIVVDDRDGLDLNIRTYLPVAEYISGFTNSQRVTFEFITGKWLQGEQCLAFITGGGGVGKSYLLDSLVAFCNENHKTVQKLATTGCAAHLIGGITIHSFLRMSPDLQSHIERGTIDSYFIDKLDVLLIDEVSMLEERVMYTLELCMNVHSYSNVNVSSAQKRFAGKSVIMFGDPAQLPPVGKHIWQHQLINGFHMAVLKETVRQKNDKQFVDLLNRVRMGEPSDDDINLLQSRVVTSTQLQQIEIGDRGLMLFPTRRQKNEMNAYELTKLSGDTREYLAEDIDDNGKPLPKSVREYIAYLEEKNQLLPAVLKLKIGARVMLVRNRDIEHGWVNGALATVINMSDDYIVISAVNNPQCRLITFRIRQEIRDKNANQLYFRRQFPLDLAYGVTIHKSQGQTLDVVVVSAKCLSFSGQFYTAISRVRELDGLYLMHFNADAIFLSPEIRKLIEWINEVDVTLPHASQTIRKRIPDIAQITSRPGWTIAMIPHDIIPNNNVVTTTTTASNATITTTVVESKSNKQMLPVKQKTSPPPTPDHHGKRVRFEFTSNDQILESIYNLDTNMPLERYLESFDAVFVQHQIQRFGPTWKYLINYSRGSEFCNRKPEHSVDQNLSDKTYTAISKEYGRVIRTSGDNSCLFHALSLCLFTHENNHRQIRMMCCLAFRENSAYFATDHVKIHCDYESVQLLIKHTANMRNCQEAWGGSAHLKAMAMVSCREIYVYTCFANQNGSTHPKCLADQNLSIAELQRKCNASELHGTYFTRYAPNVIPTQPKRPLTVLLSGTGGSAHYSAILPITDNVPLVRPFVEIPPPLRDIDNVQVLLDNIDISDDNDNNIMIISDDDDVKITNDPNVIVIDDDDD